MSDQNPVDVVDIGTVAAANIAKALNLKDEPEKFLFPTAEIRKAIADEINAMSSHFTLAFADIQTQYEAAVYQAKLEYQKAIGAFNFVKSNTASVGLAAGLLFSLGLIVGHFA